MDVTQHNLKRSLFLCTSVSTVLLVLRIILNQHFIFSFLLWNLFLAYLPWLLAKKAVASEHSIPTYWMYHASMVNLLAERAIFGHGLGAPEARITYFLVGFIHVFQLCHPRLHLWFPILCSDPEKSLHKIPYRRKVFTSNCCVTLGRFWDLSWSSGPLKLVGHHPPSHGFVSVNLGTLFLCGGQIICIGLYGIHGSVFVSVTQCLYFVGQRKIFAQVKRFIISFGHAITGLSQFFRKEKNGQIQLVMAVFVVILGFVLHIEYMEWVAVLLCIGGVLTLEMVNSSIEQIMNLLHPDYSKKVKNIKDLSAGAVLLFSAIALIVGLMVFAPRLIELFY
jgi:undecaprenol kinase